MLHVYPKTCFLLCSLWIRAMKAADYYCNVGYALDTDGKAVCEAGYPNTLRYKCELDDCYISEETPTYIVMTKCQLIKSNGSLDPALTIQHCEQYQYVKDKNNYNCYTDKKDTYACAYTPGYIDPIRCSTCTQLPKQDP
ncbi:uncharacterized protein MELLADRAFT_124131 [Melampsora larici-populina 98AG31]|uniref:Secreted protein n=1 Tax=Melampsora larici-populina (strain 98AG31 / pathotype 3-4-7) TaxID=747676 RepID=F4S902_MELLP|nr:uncharacterized protein MELLADRAFT_124131 [Melampsora larici-populina 98AG31]EGF98901.1 secreted protein [Melampsora larici-populina 98AG31]